jgi:hypothetical protein
MLLLVFPAVFLGPNIIVHIILLNNLHILFRVLPSMGEAVSRTHARQEVNSRFYTCW